MSDISKAIETQEAAPAAQHGWRDKFIAHFEAERRALREDCIRHYVDAGMTREEAESYLDAVEDEYRRSCRLGLSEARRLRMSDAPKPIETGQCWQFDPTVTMVITRHFGGTLWETLSLDRRLQVLTYAQGGIVAEETIRRDAVYVGECEWFLDALMKR